MQRFAKKSLLCIRIQKAFKIFICNILNNISLFIPKLTNNINKKVYKLAQMGYNVSWYKKIFQVGVKNNGNEH